MQSQSAEHQQSIDAVSEFTRQHNAIASHFVQQIRQDIDRILPHFQLSEYNNPCWQLSNIAWHHLDSVTFTLCQQTRKLCQQWGTASSEDSDPMQIADMRCIALLESAQGYLVQLASMLKSTQTAVEQAKACLSVDALLSNITRQCRQLLSCQHACITFSDVGQIIEESIYLAGCLLQHYPLVSAWPSLKVQQKSPKTHEAMFHFMTRLFRMINPCQLYSLSVCNHSTQPNMADLYDVAALIRAELRHCYQQRYGSMACYTGTVRPLTATHLDQLLAVLYVQVSAYKQLTEA